MQAKLVRMSFLSGSGYHLKVTLEIDKLEKAALGKKTVKGKIFPSNLRKSDIVF